MQFAVKGKINKNTFDSVDSVPKDGLILLLSSCPRFSRHFTLFCFTIVKSNSFLCHVLTCLLLFVFLLFSRLSFSSPSLSCCNWKYLKSCSGNFYSPESDPPHKIMRYWFYYSIWLGFLFPTDRIRQMEMICIGGVPVSKKHFGGAGPSIFYMVQWGGRIAW